MRTTTTGAGKVTARLNRIASPVVARKVGQAVFEGAKLHTVTAQRLITAGSVSGKGHVASRPGESPNRDTGLLDNNIEASQVSLLKSRSSSNAPYAFLEFGTSTIEARPYMGPATDIVRDQVIKNIAAAAQQVIRS
jgi:hypothetical protein